MNANELDPGIAAKLKRDADGLFAAIAQERGTGAVLMLAWMDDAALARTLATREATYFSRSRGEHDGRYWMCHLSSLSHGARPTVLAGGGGFEPPTDGFKVRCSAN